MPKNLFYLGDADFGTQREMARSLRTNYCAALYGKVVSSNAADARQLFSRDGVTGRATT